MRVASTLLGAALALPYYVRAGNIDKDGFTMDGVATYCQGLGKATGTFPQLDKSSLNRCPILVNLTPSATTVHKNTPLEVKFKAAAKFGEIPDNIFPRAITDQGAKKVSAVQASFVKWCKAGTNCDKPMDGTPFGAEAGTGDFDATGAKALPSYRFTFADPGDYVLFGQVTLPGDPKLDVSGQQFVAFQKITVVDTGASIAPSPSPTPSPPLSSSSPAPSSAPPSNGTSIGFNTINNRTSSGSVASESGVVKAAVDKPSNGAPSTPSNLPLEGTQTNAGSAETDKGFFSSRGTLLAAVAGACVVVMVLGYAVAMRRKGKSGVEGGGAKADPRGPTPTFRMSHNNNHSSDDMDDPEPVAYMRKKSVRGSTMANANAHSSLPILGGTSTSSTDEIDVMPMHTENMDYDEGTVTASNKAIATQVKHHHHKQSPDVRASSMSSRGMAASSLYDDSNLAPASLYDDDRGTALYKETQKPSKKNVRASEQERAFYESEQWDAGATAHPYDDRDVSMMSFNDENDDGGASGFGIHGAMDDHDEEGRTSRFNSEASVDSYAFRPSRVSVAESYQSRVSRNSYADSEMSRESSRISGMSLYSDRGTNV